MAQLLSDFRGAGVPPVNFVLVLRCRTAGRTPAPRKPLSPMRCFEVSMPTSKWNGKCFVAGGGYNGVIPRLTQALAEGYAAAGSDTGHEAYKLGLE